ncbi:MAG: toprim domain-containing protein [Tannerella sp.]|nr:toprim domain-containing protein [Tannerella sp.]
MKIDFTKFKTDISLPDFLLKFGWKFTVGSSYSSPKMTDGIQTIVIKRNSQGYYTYWDVHDESIRGRTIIDFMQKHLFSETGKVPSLREVGIILQGYINSNEIVVPEKSRYTLCGKELDTAAICQLINQLQPYKGDFLSKRGINSEILSSSTFKDTFYSRIFRKEDVIYNNTCVRMTNQNGCQGISQRNENFKGIIGSHYDCLAFSRYDDSRPVDEAFVGESILDCAAHYQLKYFNSQKNILYMSTEGALTDGQMNLIKLILSNSKSKINNIITIFDNDKNGLLYTIRLNSFLNNIPSPAELTNQDTETLKEIIKQYNNVDLSKNKDWNDDLLSIIKIENQSPLTPSL